MKVYGHLGVSINRLISLKYPFKVRLLIQIKVKHDISQYHSMESKSAVTILYVVSVTLIAFLQVTPLFSCECINEIFNGIDLLRRRLFLHVLQRNCSMELWGNAMQWLLFIVRLRSCFSPCLHALFLQLRRFCPHCIHYVLHNCSGFHLTSHFAEGEK